jgi:UDP:flavonoid glycosyltransferase YjiC (YdhE family)
MRLTILAYGTRGDVQPYVALGLGLKAAGHRVRLAAPAAFEGFITGYGLDFAPIAGDPAEISRLLVDRGAGNPIRIVGVIIDQMRKLAAPAMRDVQAACADADAILHSFHMLIPGHTVARTQGVPDIFVHAYPICAPTAAFPSVIFPPLPLGPAYNRLTHALTDQLIWQTHRLLHTLIRRDHPDLPQRLLWPFGERATPTLFGFSPLVIPPPADWRGEVHVTGCWFLDAQAGWQPPDHLERFLDAGPPPVYIGFGSMLTRDAQKLTRTVLEALRLAGQRGVLLGWGGGLGGGGGDLISAADVCLIDTAPHDWLFPRMAAVAHHCGAGTAAAGLRAGVPSILLPITNEQPFWADRVKALGVGPAPVPLCRLTAERLAEAIHAATTNRAIQDRAAEVGQLIRAEDGVGNAVKIINRLLGVISIR